MFEILENHNDLSKEEAIRRIEQVYHAGYNPNWPDFDAYEQLLVCESLAETEAEELKKYGRTKENVNVKWNVNGSCKHNINFELTEDKRKVIAALEKLTYNTSPILVGELLENLFTENNSQDGHWLYIAQHWNPRAINRVIKQMIKLQDSGRISIQNPAAFFTYKIQRRRRRRDLLSPTILLNKTRQIRH